VSERKTIETGRNLPVALAVGLGLGAIVIVTLLTVKVAFLAFVAVVVGAGLWELNHAFSTREIKLPIIPIAVGGATMYALGYWRGPLAVLATLGLAFTLMLAWRLPGGAAGFVRDVTAGTFVLLYLPLAATFVALMLAPHDGAHRALMFLILAVCADTGAYFAGILFGRHPMAHRRDEMNALGVKRAVDLARVRDGRLVRIAGSVIVRQRPGTANGFVFLSMEDETGIMNAIVTPPLFERNRMVLLREPYLLIDGALQNVDNVVSVKADRIQALEARAAAKSHDFH